MITLNTDQGLINYESWEEIKAHPGFINDLNPEAQKLDAIIGRYLFKDMIKCGLSNCHTPHSKGYIITTKEGQSTNIGKDCGKKYFGVDFEELSKKFDRDFTEKENRIRLESFRFQIEELERTIVELRKKDHGADWVYKKIRPLLTYTSKECPEVIVRRISAMSKTGTNILSVEREATQKEAEALEVAQGRKIQRPHIIEEPIAEISGIRALSDENDLRKMLVLYLEVELQAFKGNDIDLLSYDDLRHWTKWANSVESTLEKAETSVALGHTLLSRRNLEPFNRILTTNEEKNIFRSYLKSCLD